MYGSYRFKHMVAILRLCRVSGQKVSDHVLAGRPGFQVDIKGRQSKQPSQLTSGVLGVGFEEVLQRVTVSDAANGGAIEVGAPKFQRR